MRELDVEVADLLISDMYFIVLDMLVLILRGVQILSPSTFKISKIFLSTSVDYVLPLNSVIGFPKNAVFYRYPKILACCQR